MRSNDADKRLRTEFGLPIGTGVILPGPGGMFIVTLRRLTEEQARAVLAVAKSVGVNLVTA